jgi:hypothetical protein
VDGQHRGDLDEGAGTGREQARQHRVRQPGERGDVQRDLRHRILHRRLREGPPARDARVVDQQLHAGIAPEHRLEGGQVALLAQVGHQHLYLDAVRTDSLSANAFSRSALSRPRPATTPRCGARRAGSATSTTTRWSPRA